MTAFLLLIIVAIVLGLIGAVAAGLGVLLVIGVILFVGDLAWGIWRLRRRRVRPMR